MASITSLSNSSYNTSSIYGNRNILSGLASGMDTETMIENAVSGIKQKIQTLQQRRTKIEWQQEAFRSIIDKAVALNSKYASYTSKTNLLSSSFFSNAVNTTTLGTYADKISASGKTSSNIKINSVKQMAKSATYTTSGLGGLSSGEISGITGKDFDITADIPVSTVSGTLSIKYGGTNGTSFDIQFDELEDISKMEGGTNAEKLANAINKKLSEITYTYTKNGFTETTTADKAIRVTANSGRISFADGLGNGNKVIIGSATGNIRSTFSITGSEETGIAVGSTPLIQQTDTRDYLADKELGITFNGTTKTISMADVLDGIDFTYDSGEDNNLQFQNALQKELDNAFGTGKIKASYEDGKLSLTPQGEGDTMALGGTAVEALGFTKGDTNYINTTKKLSELLGDNADSIFTQENRMKGTGRPIIKTSPNGSVYYVDSAGNRVDKDGYRVDDSGKAIYDFEVNGTHINVTEDTTLESLMNSINSNADTGLKVSYSKLTNEFKFTTTDTGANSKIEFGGLAKSLFADSSSTSDKFADIYGLNLANGEVKDVSFKLPGASGSSGYSVTIKVDKTDTMESIAEKLNNIIPNMGKGHSVSYNELSGQLIITDKNNNMVDFTAQADGKDLKAEFTSSYTPGQDSIVDVEINGKRFENLTRSSNTLELDGMTINIKGTFDEVGKDGEDYEPITFNTTTDTDKIIDAIRSFVDDYNEMVTELKNAYSTLPAENSSGSRYEPLTAEQEAEYTETELAAYNEKAKQGLLFGDTTLSSMYSKLLNAIQPGGTDGQTLREIGIGTSYSEGMTTISLDEEKLRTALESDPEKVKDAFTKSKEGGSSSDGLMKTLQNTLNTYVKTTGEPKGVLIAKAGSIKAPTSLNNNSLKSQMDSIDTQIERWQNKMSDQIDRYTTQFTRLEQLVAEMNSQASAFAGLMGGSSGY